MPVKLGATMTGITIAAAGNGWQVSTTGKAGRLGWGILSAIPAPRTDGHSVWRWVWSCLIPATSALAQDADALSFDQAREAVERVSDALAAAGHNLRARRIFPMTAPCGCGDFARSALPGVPEDADCPLFALAPVGEARSASKGRCGSRSATGDCVRC